MQKAGFEWFYRFVQEPRRMWKRYVVGNWQYIQLTYRTRKQLKRTVKDKR
jgi:N-acetylglucosaminyldiphosphoundecaprenol N-acetyl-beta-D-mannosaminyltransferase